MPILGSPRSRLSKVPDWEELAAKAHYSAPELARLCGVSLRHIQRHFRHYYGLHVREWLNRRRLCVAYERLREVESVKEVVFELGYKQPSQFSRDFTKFHGISPSRLTKRKSR